MATDGDGHEHVHVHGPRVTGRVRTRPRERERVRTRDSGERLLQPAEHLHDTHQQRTAALTVIGGGDLLDTQHVENRRAFRRRPSRNPVELPLLARRSPPCSFGDVQDD